MSVIVFLDTETGGLNPDTDSLLSIGLIAYQTDTDEILSEQEILVWDDVLQKSPEALRINHIDIDRHREVAVTRDEAARQLAAFVRPEWRKARMACHNAPFDVGFIKALMGPQFGRVFQFHPLCTMQLALWLCHGGHIPTTSVALGTICEYFGIDPGEAHTALADARSALQVYRRVIPLVRAA